MSTLQLVAMVSFNKNFKEAMGHKVILSDHSPVGNRLAPMFAAAALISEASHFFRKKKKLRTPLGYYGEF